MSAYHKEIHEKAEKRRKAMLFLKEKMGMTYKEIGAKFSISKQRVEQIINRISK